MCECEHEQAFAGGSGSAGLLFQRILAQCLEQLRSRIKSWTNNAVKNFGIAQVDQQPLADEALQSIVVRLHRYAHTYDPKKQSKLKLPHCGWAFGVARNAWYTFLDKKIAKPRRPRSGFSALIEAWHGANVSVSNPVLHFLCAPVVNSLTEDEFVLITYIATAKDGTQHRAKLAAQQLGIREDAARQRARRFRKDFAQRILDRAVSLVQSLKAINLKNVSLEDSIMLAKLCAEWNELSNDQQAERIGVIVGQIKSLVGILVDGT